MHTRSQRYAATVFRQIQEVPDEKHQRYAGLAHRLPVLIRTAGLAQALAYASARCNDISLLDDLAEAINCGKGQALLERSRDADITEYMRLTREALAALLWYKRFAQAVWDIDPAEQEGDAP